MTLVQIEIQLVAILTASACALVGVFLILRGMAMMSDAISHAILFGIVLAFFWIKDISSPLLILAAALTGLLTVSLVEIIHRTKLVREDAAMGLVFPLLFSIGVILITRYAENIHLDTDAVLLGELAFAPLNRLFFLGIDLGPKAFFIMAGIFSLNLFFILFFYKELKLTTFDSGLAAALGFMPGFIHYALMSLVSLTAVGAFDTVGSILVVALMITPPATAYLITNQLSRMIVGSIIVGVFSAISGYWIAHWLDVSIAGSMATMTGVIFLSVFLLAPENGLIARTRRRIRLRWDFAQTMLLVHLLHHTGQPEAPEECHQDHICEHLHWKPEFARQVVRFAKQAGVIRIKQNNLTLTPQGQAQAEQAMLTSALHPQE